MRQMRFFLPLILASLAIAAPSKAILQVSVVDGVSGRPLGDASVTLRAQLLGELSERDESRNAQSVNTDDSGVVRFEALMPGSYRLQVERAGYGYSRNRIGRDSSQPLIEIRENQTTLEHVCRLFPPGEISGKVRGSDGHPIGGVRIVAYTMEHLDGKAKLVEQKAGLSSRDGLYRITDLGSGLYRLRAVPPESPLAKQWIPNFYPSGDEALLATGIVVRAGQESSGIDFKLQESEVWPVTGTFSFSGVLISAAIYVEKMLTLGAGQYRAIVNRNHEFRVSALPPGEYRVRAVLSLMDSSGTPVREAGSQKFVVKDAAVAGLKLDVRRRFGLQGQVIRRGGTASEALPLPDGLSIVSRPLPFHRVSLRWTRSQPNGKGQFEFRDLPEVPQMLTVQGLPREIYVKRIVLGTRDVLRLPFVPAPEERLEIELAEGSSLVGFASGEDAKPLSGAVVLLMRADGAGSNSDWKWIGETGANGDYLKSGIPPGVYRLCVFHSLDLALLDDPSYRKKIRDEGSGIAFPEAHGRIVKSRSREAPAP